jgi:hypothetical protein
MQIKWYEPQIKIGLTDLSVGEAMTLRVALESFLMGLQDKHALGDDEHGIRMRDGYIYQGTRILSLMGDDVNKQIDKDEKK